MVFGWFFFLLLLYFNIWGGGCVYIGVCWPAMPTPVTAARQCLTEEAARALDDAVAVARRRSHAQTTSLHAVSALLAMPSSTLREACARARGNSYSARLQFRALELCLGVSLDRMQSSKSVEDPPISNSLMAAIKRSQASQRRHPESYHLQQMHSSSNSANPTASLLKVELKYFILSILDDPIVSRVFEEAGFRSCEIKVAILHPPMTQLAPRFSRSRCPPIFLCNLTDSDLGRRGFGLPYYGSEDFDDNCRKITEVLARKDKRNPLLVGISASDALRSFSDFIQRGKTAVLPPALSGLSVISIEKEIIEFVDGNNEESMDLKLKEVGQILQRCTGSGLVMNFGDLKVLLGEDSASTSSDALSSLVSKLTSFLPIHGGKLWLMGAAASSETYSKFLSRYPSIEKEWDLHLLPISSSNLLDRVSSKPSLMRSFVPFAGFFSTPSDFSSPFSNLNRFTPRCHLCNEKYEQEVAGVLKVESTISAADQYSDSLPPWLRMKGQSTDKEVDVTKAKNDGVTLNARIAGLQKKWNDICQRLHHIQQFPNLDIPQARSHSPAAEGFQFVADRNETNSKDRSIDESEHVISPCINMAMQDNLLAKQKIPISPTFVAENISFQPRLSVEVSRSEQKERCLLPPNPVSSVSPLGSCTTSLSITSVTTDLGLGTLYASASQEANTPKLQDHRGQLQHYSGSISTEFESNSENTSYQNAHFSSCSGPTSERLDPGDSKAISKFLAEKVGWQNEAIYMISQALCRCRTGNTKHRRSNSRGDIWLSLLGPDRVGKKKIASALAEMIFGSQENLISVDLISEDYDSQSNRIIGGQESNDCEVKFRRTVVDFIAGELGRKPNSVVFLENVDKADLLTQTSLSRAIRTGKFPDSHGRESSTNNMVFVTTSTIIKGDKNVVLKKNPTKFLEERILGAKSWQMQIKVSSSSEDARRSNDMNVRISLKEETLNAAFTNKRKLIGVSTCTNPEEEGQQRRATKMLRSYLDLNLPVEETEEDINSQEADSDSISENSEAWLEDFLDQVDEKVVFKPFNFDALAEKLVKNIHQHLQRSFGHETLLDIDQEVIVQMLAAAWLSDKERAIEDWVENVLRQSFTKARRKYKITAQCVVKLVACEGASVEEQAPGICLPAKINLS